MAQVSPSQTSGVKRDSVVTFTVTLQHSIHSTSHAYTVLLEVAVPHTYLTLNPTDNLEVVQGDKAPSGSAE